jgi:CubicO group peptidase (beta-lactamase class C family)
MKKIFAASCFTASAFCALHCGKIAPLVSVGDPNDARFQYVLGKIEDDMSKYGVPGAAVAIVLDGKLAFAAGLGNKRRDEADPVDATTLFRVDSLSKMVLSATALKLVSEGKLDLSQPITSYVPFTLAAPFDPSTITTFDLLTHTSGVPDISVNTTDCATGPGQAAAWFAAHGSQPLWAPPGAVWNYSNQGYGVAGWIVETVSGQSYEDAVAERVFGPANMTTATYDVDAVTASPNHAAGHTKSQILEPNFYDCAVTRPPGGVIASVIDYAHFAETLFADDGSMIDDSSISAMETGHVDTDELPNAQEKYGYGLEAIDGYKGVHVVMHTGSDEAYHSVFVTVPDQKFAAIIFYNSGERSPETVAKDALDEFLNLRDVPAPVYSTDPSTWGKYAGTYVDPNDFGAVDVTFDGSSLAFSAPSVGDFSLSQVAGDEFAASINGSTLDVTFYPDDAGNPKWFVTRAGVGERQ